MIKPTDTLIDNLYRETFASRPKVAGWKTDLTVLDTRKALRAARRFVLSDNMSSFLADLGCEAFIGKYTHTGHDFANGEFLGRLPRRYERAIEQMRVSARLPHKITWVEFNSGVRARRLDEIANRPFISREGEINREGWLLETNENDNSEQSFTATVFIQTDDALTTVPFTYWWSTYDTPGVEPDKNTGWLSEIITGIPGYRTNHIRTYYTRDFGNDEESIAHAQQLLRALSGTVRFMWALLATINDLPVTFKRVEQTKGFIGGHLYRKFLEHSIITLNVPDNRDLRKIARKAIAAARKRAHQVRGHWRKDWRHEGGRIWVREHQRGDASIGFVTHDYSVEHPKENNAVPHSD